MGGDGEKLLDRGETMCQACRPSVAARDNPGLWLGAIMGALAQRGHDKLTLVMSPPISTFGYWVEQLIAESTGKEGKGIVPVEGEALGAPSVYGTDRLFVYLRTDEGFDPEQDERLARLDEAAPPVGPLQLRPTYGVRAEFFGRGFAAPTARALLGLY